MAKLAIKTKLILIIFFVNITTCDNASGQMKDCGRRPVSFQDEVTYDEPEDRRSYADRPSTGSSGSMLTFIGAGLGGLAALVAAPIVLPAVGFTAGGIAAGSMAASMMSSAAIANGGAIAAGSTVAVLQSAGVLGLGAAGTAAVGGAGAAAGVAVSAALN